jgi:hypothetical protein
MISKGTKVKRWQREPPFPFLQLASVALLPLDVLAGHASEDFECGTIKSRL